MSTTCNLQPRHDIIRTLRYSKLLKPTPEQKIKSDDIKLASPPLQIDHPPSLTAWKSAEQNLEKKPNNCQNRRSDVRNTVVESGNLEEGLGRDRIDCQRYPVLMRFVNDLAPTRRPCLAMAAAILSHYVAELRLNSNT